MTKVLFLISFMFSISALAANPLDVILEIEVQHGVECIATHDSTSLCLNKLCWYKKSYLCSGEDSFGVELRIQSKELSDETMNYRVRSVKFVR